MFIRKSFWVLVAIVAGVGSAAMDEARCQDIPAVKVEDLKASPQRYWAGFFVFNDVLKAKPDRKTLRIDGRTVTRFQTTVLGDVYAESSVLPRFNDFKEGDELMLVATVSQKAKSLLGFFRRDKFIVIVKDITLFEKKAEEIPGLMEGINRETSTNEFNQVFMVLEGIMRDVHQDMFGFASSQNIPLAEVFNTSEHRDKVAASVRAALRKLENRQRTSSQEFFVSVIISMIALQYGYVEPARPVYQPEAELPAEPVSLETAPADAVDYGSPEEWDLSGKTEAAPPEETPAPEVAAEPEPSAEIAEPAPAESTEAAPPQ